MPSYNNFDQVLRDKKLNATAKTVFVRTWLERTYGIDYGLNEAFFAELSRVHDHDNLEKHFGRVLLENSLGVLWVQLVKEPRSQKWRIAFAFPDAPDEQQLLKTRDESGSDDTLAQFKELIVAQLAETVVRGNGNDSKYGDLDSYSSTSLTEDDARQQHRGQFDPAAIPGYLYDPAWVPGVPGAQRSDPTLNLDFEEIVARFQRSA